jgi:hypothetical protein
LRGAISACGGRSGLAGSARGDRARRVWPA